MALNHVGDDVPFSPHFLQLLLDYISVKYTSDKRMMNLQRAANQQEAWTQCW